MKPFRAIKSLVPHVKRRDVMSETLSGDFVGWKKTNPITTNDSMKHHLSSSVFGKKLPFCASERLEGSECFYFTTLTDGLRW